MPPAFSYPPKPERGDAVAVLSPSGRAPAIFAGPVDLGLARLREEFGLRPVEYPTTRAAQASPEERAADVHAAFADQEIKAVFTTIGGGDELKVLPHLDAWSFERPNDPEAKASHTSAQYEAVRTAMAEYHPDVPLVLGPDLGHTDPQQIIPFGGQITVDGANRQVSAVY